MKKNRDDRVFVPVKKMADLEIGKEIWIKYKDYPWVPYHPHVIRKRIILKEHNIPSYHPDIGPRHDESYESYREYKEWLRDRFNKGEMFFLKE